MPVLQLIFDTEASMCTSYWSVDNIVDSYKITTYH